MSNFCLTVQILCKLTSVNQFNLMRIAASGLATNQRIPIAIVFTTGKRQRWKRRVDHQGPQESATAEEQSDGIEREFRL